MGQLTKVAETKDVPLGTGIAVEAEGCRIALFNSGGSYFAIDDDCTHRGGSLSGGELEGTVVTCPLHGATFDITTGDVLGAPAPKGVVSYRVRVDGNDIKVELP